jgi:uncharacterized protein (DUF58 family)
MLPKEIIKKIQQIQIRTNRVVSDLFAGEYVSVFKGRGIEFEEVREYQPGDEIRTIDWNVTARMGRPYIKKFVEERELTVMLLVDVSGSEEFGSAKSFKREIASELAAVLAFSAIRNKDRVGLIAFTDEIEKFVPPKKGRRHVLRLIREVLYFQPRRRGTNVAAAIEYLSKVTTRRAVVFLISDFADSGFDRALKVASRRHDIIAVTIRDPRESEFPALGFVELEDAETGERMLVDSRSGSFREAFSSLARKGEGARKTLFRSAGVDEIAVATDRPYFQDLLKFFRMRERRMRF